MQPAERVPHGSGQDENIHVAARHLIKARVRTIDMILFAFDEPMGLPFAQRLFG